MSGAYRIWKITIYILLSLLVGSCGGGGGGGSSTQPVSSTTVTIGSGGGSVVLADGSTVIFSVGVVKDGTAVTVSARPPSPPASSEVQAGSAVVQVEIPQGALINSASPDTGVTIKFPASSTTVLATGIRAANTDNVLGTSYRYVKASLTAAGRSTVHYAGLAADATVATVVLTHPLLAAMGLGPTIMEVAAEWWNPNVATAGQLFEVLDGSFNVQPADSILLPADKLPLVLVHGFQLACDGTADAYKETWKEFAKFFYSAEHTVSAELRNRFTLYTYSYQTDLSIKENGRLLAMALKVAFGDQPAVVLAHSMGGLVTRSALVHWKGLGANVEGLITLGTPHHGVRGTLDDLAGKLDGACVLAADAQSAKDSAWDGSTISPTTCHNPFLCNSTDGLNVVDTNFGKYITYAGLIANQNCLTNASAFSFGLCVMAHLRVNRTGEDSDGLVPESSATFEARQSQLRAVARRYSDVNHATIHDDHEVIHGSRLSHDIVTPPNLAADLSGFYDTIMLAPPAAPSNLSTVALSQSSIALTWIDNSTDETGFYFIRKLGNAGSYAEIARVGTISGSGSSGYYEDTGLASGNLYCYRVNAYKASGAFSFSTESCATTHALGASPVATTEAATNVTPTSATLNATVNPAGVATDAYFQWGPTTAYGNETGIQYVGDSSIPVSISANLSGLVTNSTYHYRIVAAQRDGGTALGTNQTFTTEGQPGGGQIVFESNRDGYSGEIYVMNADGSAQTRLTNNSASDLHPVWSPDGSKIAFESNRNAPYDEIYVMNADGSGQARVTNNLAQDSGPAWSPDGSRIAFSSNRDFGWRIYVMNADGSGEARLTNSTNLGVYDLYPAWSPDGSKIAFMSSRDNTDVEIYIMNADGSGQARLTNNLGSDSYPAWSPDGSKIAFVSFRDYGESIYVMNADGSGPTRLTNYYQGDSYPAWSPDGNKIAFASGRDGNSEIYVMNADGSGQTRLTNNAARDSSPAWRPTP